MKDDYIYTPSTTDITIRWRKIYNYIPASEQPYYQAKWKQFREMMSSLTMYAMIVELNGELKSQSTMNTDAGLIPVMCVEN